VIHESIHHDSKGPHVYFLVELVPFEQVNLLRSSVDWRRELFDIFKNSCMLRLVNFTLELLFGAAPKVTQLPVAIIALEHVFNFDVAMCDSPLVHVLEPV